MTHGPPIRQRRARSRHAGNLHPPFDGAHNHGHPRTATVPATTTGSTAIRTTHDDDSDHDHDGHRGGSGRGSRARGTGRTRRGAALDGLPCARSLGSFLAAVADPEGEDARQLGRAMAAARPRNAAGQLSERVPSEGGFTVPERLRQQILSFMTANIVASRSLYIAMDSLRVPIPVLDNVTQASGGQPLGGMTFGMVAEGTSIPASTPTFGRHALGSPQGRGLPAVGSQRASVRRRVADQRFPAADRR